MRGIILDYTSADAFILLEDDSIATIPLSSFEELIPIGSNVSLNTIYNKSTNSNYKTCHSINKGIDFL